MTLKLNHVHPWNLSHVEAVAVQKELRKHIVVCPLPGEINLVAGVDVSYRSGRARAAVVVVDYETMGLADQAIFERAVDFPYIPGLLSFRELPSLLAAIERLSIAPDIWLCDAHGIAHPRRFGLGCHLGVLLDMPVIGCAKSILVGAHSQLGETRGSQAPLIDGAEIVGVALRTRDRVRPMYVSIGNRVDLASAIDLVLQCGRGRRMPEPTRLADKLAADWNG